MKLPPATIIAKAADHISAVSQRTSPARALLAIASKADVDDGELAEALALTGLTKLGPFDFARLPNDLAVMHAIRSDDPQAREYIKKECGRRPVGHVAAVLRCSTIWVRAAQEHWTLPMWPPTRQAIMQLPEEERLEETLTPRQIRDLVTDAMKKYDGFTSEVAWALGVSHRWVMYQLKTKGLTPKDMPNADGLVIRKGQEATLEEKRRIRERMEALGSASAWGREVGLSYNMAADQAKLVGYVRVKDRMPEETTKARLKKWIEQTGYDGFSTAGVGSAWLAKNVCLVDGNEYDKNRLIRAMKSLGFTAVRRSACTDWVWIKRPDAKPKTLVDDGKQASVWDLSPANRAERKHIRQQLLEGKVEPTPELLKQAGLKLQ